MSGCNDGCCGPAQRAPPARPANFVPASAAAAAAAAAGAAAGPRSTFPAWTLLYAAVGAAVFLATSSPLRYAAVGGLAAAQLLLTVALVGGLANFREVLEAMWQPALPASALAALGTAAPKSACADKDCADKNCGDQNCADPSAAAAAKKTMLVVGAYSGLGAAVARLAADGFDGFDVTRADLRLYGDEFVDLAEVGSIKQLAARHAGKKIDALVLCAGIVDTHEVPLPGHFTCDEVLPRMAWVNFLGNAVLLQELESQGCDVGRVVVVSSGAYARGAFDPSGPSGFFPREWGFTGALRAYAQSKFVLTAWAAWQRRVRGSWRGLQIINPGPMRSTIGDAGVPALLWPSYALAKELLFPGPEKAALAVLACCTAAAPQSDGTMLHIRAERALSAAVQDPACQAWVVKNLTEALAAVKYKFKGDLSSDDAPVRVSATGGSGAAAAAAAATASGGDAEEKRKAEQAAKASRDAVEAELQRLKKINELSQGAAKSIAKTATGGGGAGHAAAAAAQASAASAAAAAASARQATGTQAGTPKTPEQQVAELQAAIQGYAAKFKLVIDEKAGVTMIKLVLATMQGLQHPDGRQVVAPILQRLKIENLLEIPHHLMATHIAVTDPTLEGKSGKPIPQFDFPMLLGVLGRRPNLRALAIQTGAVSATEIPKRLAVHSFVEVRFKDGWCAGTIVKHNYRESNWPAGKVAAYQVRLIPEGNLIFCPVDSDQSIRVHPEAEKLKREAVQQAVAFMQKEKRHAVGAKVLVKFRDGWKTGVVTQHNYREKAWPVEKVAAYQVKLDENGMLIFCPRDDEGAIKAADGEAVNPEEAEGVDVD